MGSLQGTDAVIAFVQNREEWIGYVCGGPATYATLTRWYSGSWTIVSVLPSGSACVLAAGQNWEDVEPAVARDPAT